MQGLKDLYDKVIDELCEFGKEDLTMDNLPVIDTLAHAGKNLRKILEMEEGGGTYSYEYFDKNPHTSVMGTMRGTYHGGTLHNKKEEAPQEETTGTALKNVGKGNNVTDGLRQLMNAAPPEMQGDINRLIKKLEHM